MTPERLSPRERLPGFRWPSWLNGYLVTAIANPFLILLADRNAFFTSVGTIDPWVYHGFFGHFSEYISSWFPGTYYGSRLAWIIPGYIANALLSPVNANYVLHFAVYYLGALSLFYIVCHFYNAQTALLCSIAFTTYPYLWDAVGWDYVDGVGIGYYLGLVALMIRARQHPHWITGVFAGVVYSALFYTNAVWVLFTPLAVGIYVFAPTTGARISLSFKVIAASLTSFAVGVATLTLALCFINYRGGGRFWFYGPSINYVSSHATGVSIWKVQGYAWIWHAPWLIYPCLALLVSTVSCIRRFVLRADRTVDPAALLHFHLIGAVLIFVACEAKGLYFLDYPFYASLLMAFTLPALGCEFFRLKGRQTIEVVAIAAILFLPWSPAGPPIGSVVSGLGARFVLPAAAALAIAAVIWRGRLSAMIAASTALCLVNVYLLENNGTLQYRASAPDGRSQAFDRIIEASKFIDGERGGRRVVFWFDEHDPNGPEFDSLASIYLWGYTRMGRQFPNLDESARERVVPSSMVVVLSTRKDQAGVLSVANQSLRAWGLSAAPHSFKDVGGRGAGYHLTCLDLHRLRKGEDGTDAAPSRQADLALDKMASQSSTVVEAVAGNAVDGETDGTFAHRSVTHTSLETHAWWQVDLGSVATIHSIVIWNRTDAVGERLADYWVFVSDQPFSKTDTPSSLQQRPGIWSSHQSDQPDPSTTIHTNAVRGRYVRVQLNGSNFLSLAEVQVF